MAQVNFCLEKIDINAKFEIIENKLSELIYEKYLFLSLCIINK